MRAILNSLPVSLQYSKTLSSVSGELSFSLCDTVLLWFFMVFYVPLLAHLKCEEFSSISKLFF